MMMLLGSAVQTSVLVGHVAEHEVSLQRLKPLIGNIFKPHFYGRFTEENGRTILRGVFTMSPIAKAIVYVAFGGIAFAEALVASTVLVDGQYYSMVYPLVMAV